MSMKRDEIKALKDAEQVGRTLNFCLQDAAVGAKAELDELFAKDVQLLLATHGMLMRRAVVEFARRACRYMHHRSCVLVVHVMYAWWMVGVH